MTPSGLATTDDTQQVDQWSCPSCGSHTFAPAGGAGFTCRFCGVDKVLLGTQTVSNLPAPEAIGALSPSGKAYA